MWKSFFSVLLLSSAAVAATPKNFYEIKTINKVPIIHQNSKPISSRIFMGQYVEGMWHDRGCKPVPQEVIMARAAGVDTVMIGISTVWSDDDEKIILARLRQIKRGIVSQNPNVRFIIRLASAAPLWWKKQHPEAMARLQDGTIPDWLPKNRLNRQKVPCSATQMESTSNKLYRESAGKALSRTVRLCEKELGNYMMGYLVLCQMTSESQYFSAYVDNVLDGYDEGAREGFREYLAKKYGSDAALQKAWNRNDVTLNTAEIPSPERRNGDGVHLLREPAKYQDVIDMEDYLSVAMSDMILHFAKCVKEAQNGRLVGFFYGYVASMTHSFFGGGGQHAHLRLREVLNSPHIDFLCAPFDYTSRFITGAGTMQGVTESVLLAGKLWLNEDDTSTHIAKALGDRSAGWDSALPTAEGTITMLRRNLVATSLRNCGIWWMDLHGLGWFLDPTLWKEMADRADLDFAVRKTPVFYEPEQAVAVDTRSIWHWVGRHPRFVAMAQIGNIAQKHMALTGAAYGTYLQEDILEGRAPKVKYTVFATTCAMDSNQRKAMRKYAENHGTIFAWNPAYIDLNTGKFSLKAVEEATGFKARLVDPAKINWKLKTTSEGLKFGLNPKGYESFPGERRGVTGRGRVCELVWPIVTAVPEKGDQVLLRFSDGSPAAVYRPGKAPSVFFAAGRIPRELIRKVGELSGVHYTGPIGSAVYENAGFTGLFAPFTGEYLIEPRQPGKYVDTILGRTMGNGRKFKVNLKQGETVLLKKVQ
ncbi:MAG: beta-galactosidase [Lentisphaeria bacterium]|nr:beta-galactosidase [Lentisphaeria bacterium]